MTPAQAGARQRRERSDKGKVTITPRDAVVLKWIGEQYAVRLDQLQMLLGHRAQAPTQADGLVSADTARRVITRWAKAGWVEHRRVFHRQPEWVWLTRAGMRLAGLEYFAGQPSPVMPEPLRQLPRGGRRCLVALPAEGHAGFRVSRCLVCRHGYGRIASGMQCAREGREVLRWGRHRPILSAVVRSGPVSQSIPAGS
jgi:hypothetical protein